MGDASEEISDREPEILPPPPTGDIQEETLSEERDDSQPPDIEAGQIESEDVRLGDVVEDIEDDTEDVVVAVETADAPEDVEIAIEIPEGKLKQAKTLFFIYYKNVDGDIKRVLEGILLEYFSDVVAVWRSQHGQLALDKLAIAVFNH